MNESENTDIYSADTTKILMNPIAKEISDLLVDALKKFITDPIRKPLGLDKSTQKKNAIGKIKTNKQHSKSIPQHNFPLLPDSSDYNEGLDLLVTQTILKLCTDVNNTLNVVINIDREIIYEVICSVIKTLSGMDKQLEKSISYKPAIIAYWIVRLKPLKIEDPNKLLTFFKGNEKSKIFGRKPFPINEYVGIYTGYLIFKDADLSRTKKLDYKYQHEEDLIEDNFKISSFINTLKSMELSIDVFRLFFKFSFYNKYTDTELWK